MNIFWIVRIVNAGDDSAEFKKTCVIIFNGVVIYSTSAVSRCYGTISNFCFNHIV